MLRTEGFAFLLAVSIAAPASAANLVTNGDFSNGATGYRSDYTGTDDTGRIDVAVNPHAVNSAYASIDGAFNGHGNQLVVDGAANRGTVFWSQVVEVARGASYDFSFAIANLFTSGASPNVGAYVDGRKLFGSGVLPYDQFYRTVGGSYLATVLGPVTLSLIDLDTSVGANAFAIDDIRFANVSPAAASAVPEPATWGTMLVGFAIAGGTLRQRQRPALAA